MNARLSKMSLLMFAVPFVALTLSGSAFAGKKWHRTLFVTIQKELVFKAGSDAKVPVFIHRSGLIERMNFPKSWTGAVGECVFYPKGPEYWDFKIAPGTILPMEYDGWEGDEFLYVVKDPGYVRELSADKKELVPTERAAEFDGITMYCGQEKSVTWDWLEDLYSKAAEKLLKFSIVDPSAPAKK
jgi:hypothetical protein